MSEGNTRVLIADDDPLVRMIMVDTLGDAGFDILEATNGIEACRLLDDPDNIDLVVTDLNMPGSDGIEVAKCARTHHPKVPVLFVSGRPDLLTSLPFPYRYLAKPFTLQTLAATVRELLHRV